MAETHVRLPEQLVEAFEDLRATNPVITTVGRGRPNRIARVGPEGVWIETGASAAKHSGPQLVPAWMILAAWDHLTTSGRLENAYALSSSGLGIKRSSAVCALLAHLPGVSVASSRPVVLVYDDPQVVGSR